MLSVHLADSCIFTQTLFSDSITATLTETQQKEDIVNGYPQQLQNQLVSLEASFSGKLFKCKIMWSRFRRLAFQSILSKPNVLKNATSVCVAASIVDWIQKNDTDFKVPTFDELQSATDHHLQNQAKIMGDGEENNNLRFFKEYDDVIAEYTSKLEDKEEREILNYSPAIIDSISGRYGLKDCVVVEIGSGTGVFIPDIQSAIGDKGCYIGLDISPAFLYYTNEKFGASKNVKLNLCNDSDLNLPSKLKGKVDVFFICATYHHLQDVHSILKQCYEYMRPGGKLVIVEFKKHDHHHHHGHGDHNEHQHEHEHEHGKKVNHQAVLEQEFEKSNWDKEKIDTEWIKKHIPFTESQAKEEIQMNGFRYERDIMRDQWKDHFIHVYRKPQFL